MTPAIPRQRTFTTPHWRGLLAAAQDVLLVVVVTSFFASHMWMALHGHISSLFFACEQAITVMLFVMRRRSSATSSRAWEWAAAGAGTWLPLLLQTRLRSQSARQSQSASLPLWLEPTSRQQPK